MANTPLSDKFFLFVQEYKKEDIDFADVKLQCVLAIADYLFNDPFVEKRMLERMEAGRKQYGDAIFSKSPEAIDEEIHQEELDVLIYTLIKRFNYVQKAGKGAKLNPNAGRSFSELAKAKAYWHS